jgi:hypothetical protein
MYEKSIDFMSESPKTRKILHFKEFFPRLKEVKDIGLTNQPCKKGKLYVFLPVLLAQAQMTMSSKLKTILAH